MACVAATNCDLADHLRQPLHILCVKIIFILNFVIILYSIAIVYKSYT